MPITKIRLNQVKLLPDRGGWVDINVWDVVSNWLKNPLDNLGLVIKAQTGAGVDIPVGVTHQSMESNVSESVCNCPKCHSKSYFAFRNPICNLK